MTFLLFALIGLAAAGGVVVILYRRTPALPHGTMDMLRKRVSALPMSALRQLTKRNVLAARQKVYALFSPPEFVKENDRHDWKGMELQALRPSAETEDFWIRLIKNNPRNAYLYKRLGEFYLRNKQEEYALQTFKHAQKLAPKDESIKKYIGQIEHEHVLQ